MNTKMWQHPATQANLATLAGRGAHIVPPAVGLLADGDIGPGRLPEIEVIVDELERAVAADRPLRGVSVLITAGGTREPIDAVRYVGNRSSGKMAWALADEASRRGADVTVLAANVDLPRRPDIVYVDTPTAHEMLIACRAYHRDADIVIMAAAVADYRPASAVAGKIDKSQSERPGDPAGADRRHPDRAVPPAPAGTGAGRLRRRGRCRRARAGPRQARAQRRSIWSSTTTSRRPASGSAATRTRITIIGPGEREEMLARAPKRECARHILDAALDDLRSRPRGVPRHERVRGLRGVHPRPRAAAHPRFSPGGGRIPARTPPRARQGIDPGGAGSRLHGLPGFRRGPARSSRRRSSSDPTDGYAHFGLAKALRAPGRYRVWPSGISAWPSAFSSASASRRRPAGRAGGGAADDRYAAGIANPRRTRPS